jgi:WD40 repeat protein
MSSVPKKFTLLIFILFCCAVQGVEKKMVDDRLALLGHVIPIYDVCDIVIRYVPLFQGKHIHQLTWCKEAAVSEIYRLSDTRVGIQSLDGVLFIWDLVLNACIRTIRQRGGIERVAAINKSLLACAGPYEVTVWDIHGNLRANLHLRAFRMCAVRTGLAVLEGTRCKLAIWDWSHSSFAVKVMTQPAALGTDLIPIDNGHLVAVSFDDYTVRTFDVHTGDHLLIFTGRSCIKRLQSVSAGLLFEHDQLLQVWNVKKQVLTVIPIDMASYHVSAVVSASSDCLVAITVNGTAHAWNLADGTQRANFVIDIPYVSWSRPHQNSNMDNVRDCVAVGDFVAVHVGSRAVRIYS